MARSSNFTDKQKAELFVLHKATCAYSGENLWMLDYGADPYHQIDWADHVVPVSKGGKSTIANGVCAGWLHNYNKSDKSADDHPCFFRGGQPTEHYFRLSDTRRSEIDRQMNRFAQLHYLGFRRVPGRSGSEIHPVFQGFYHFRQLVLIGGVGVNGRIENGTPQDLKHMT